MCTYLYIIMAYNDIEPPTHEEWKAKGTERERENIIFSLANKKWGSSATAIKMQTNVIGGVFV